MTKRALERIGGPRRIRVPVAGVVAAASLAAVAAHAAEPPDASFEGGLAVQGASPPDDLRPELRPIASRLTNDTPTARWVARKAQELRAAPSDAAMERMKNGCILRASEKLFIAEEGDECPAKRDGCRRVVARLFRWLANGLHDPTEFRARITAMKPNQVDSHAVDYHETVLSDDPYVLAKSYRLDFSLIGIGLFRAPVSHVQYLAASGPGFLVFRERNLAPDGYVEDFNNLAIYLETEEGIVSTSLTVVEYRGGYARLDGIRWLGSKTMEGALKAQAIVRQYVLDPDAGPERAVERGGRDFEKVQRRPYCSEPEGSVLGAGGKRDSG